MTISKSAKKYSLVPKELDSYTKKIMCNLNFRNVRVDRGTFQHLKLHIIFHATQKI
jgi:hypothetical protein